MANPLKYITAWQNRFEIGNGSLARVCGQSQRGEDFMRALAVILPFVVIGIAMMVVIRIRSRRGGDD